MLRSKMLAMSTIPVVVLVFAVGYAVSAQRATTRTNTEVDHTNTVRQLLAEIDTRISRGQMPAERGPWLDAIAGYRKEWEDFIAPGFKLDTTPINPQRAAREIDQVLPEDGILVSDIGVHHNWINQFCAPRRPDCRRISATRRS